MLLDHNIIKDVRFDISSRKIVGTERSQGVFYEVEVKYLFEISYYNCKPSDYIRVKASSKYRKNKGTEIKPYNHKASANQKQCQE